MSDVDLYIMRFSPEIQLRLMRIRCIAQDALKHAEERIYFGIPTLSVDGKDIMHYAAYKNHISLIVGYDMADFLKTLYPQFQYTRATITFQHKAPFPDDVVQAIFGLVKQRFIDG